MMLVALAILYVFVGWMIFKALGSDLWSAVAAALWPLHLLAVAWIFIGIGIQDRGVAKNVYAAGVLAALAVVFALVVLAALGLVASRVFSP